MFGVYEVRQDIGQIGEASVHRAKRLLEKEYVSGKYFWWWYSGRTEISEATM